MSGDCKVTSIKIVMVGDIRVGKSGLIQRFISNKSPKNIYQPTGFDKYSASYEVAGFKYFATIWDTSGSSFYDTVRALTYQGTNCFLICFHLGDWYSLHNALNKWYPEVRKYTSSSTPIVLVGCQNDQRYVKNLYTTHLVQNSVTETLNPIAPGVVDVKQKVVYTEEALEVCHQMGAITYIETCAYNTSTVQEAFEIGAMAANAKLASFYFTQSSISNFKYSKNLLSTKYFSISSSIANTSISDSCISAPESDSSSSIKLKSSTNSIHFLTRHKSLFKPRKSKSKCEPKKVEGKKEKSCEIM